MKNFIRFMCLTLSLYTFCTQTLQAQQSKEVERNVRLPNGTMDSKTYLETGNVLKVDLDIEHDSLLALIHQFCPDWQIGQPLCGGTDTLYKNKIVAGFCFLPAWNIGAEVTSSTSNYYPFTTDSIRVALVLWKPKSSTVSVPDEIVLAGFGTDHRGILEALPGTHVDQAQLATNTRSFPAVRSIDTAMPPKSSAYDAAEAALYADSREFDFAFLEINRYWQLATSDDYYVGNRASQGIIVERAFSIIDVLNDPNAQGPQESRFRTLSARPYPALEQLPNFNSEAAIARELMYHCPPGWRDTPKTLLWQVKDAGNYIAQVRSSDLPSDQNKNLGLSLHVGTELTGESLDLQNLSYELGILYPLRNNLGLETLIGRYRFGAQTVDGVSLLGRYRINFDKNTKKVGAYFGLGLGFYDTPGDNQIGFTGGTGINYRFGLGSSEQLEGGANLPLQLETGVQYQNFGLIAGSDLSSNVVSLKFGLRYMF